jgi:hypothetical protein
MLAALDPELSKLLKSFAASRVKAADSLKSSKNPSSFGKNLLIMVHPPES